MTAGSGETGAPAPRTWSAAEALALMTEQDLEADMFPTLNEAEGTWEVCLSDRKGNGVEYLVFVSEADANTFCDQLGEAIETAASRA